MAEFCIKTTTGNQDISVEQIQQLLRVGKLKPHLRVISSDGGQTFMTVGDALIQTVEIEETSADEVVAAPVATPKAGRAWQTSRVILIVCSGLLVLCLFTPVFYLSVPGGTRGARSTAGLVMGWSTWFGVMAFVFGLLALAMAITDLALKRSVVAVDLAAKWVYLGLYSVIALVTVLGTLLAIYGVGLSVSSPMGAIEVSSLSGLLPITCTPITAVLLALAGVAGLVVAARCAFSKHYAL